MSKIFGVYQGSFLPLEEIRVSPLSRAYTFSDSVYEVIPYFYGRPFCLIEHLERLSKSLDATKIYVDLNRVEDEINQLSHYIKNHENAYIYYQVTRGVDSIRSHQANHDELVPELFGYAVEIKTNTSPIQAKLCEDIRWMRCDVKSTSLLGNILMMNDAQESDCSEIIFYKDDFLCEGGASNVFLSVNGAILTPSLQSNILSGITRNFLIKSLTSKDIIVQETDCNISLLEEASTIWFTSSTRGILPIENLVNSNYHRDPKDPVFNQCKEIYEESFKNYFAT